jgi:hypothetical protein
MTLFATCPSCTIEMWGWQRTCSVCATASRPSPVASPATCDRADAAAVPSRIGQLLAGLAVAVGRVAPDHCRTP